MDEQEPTRESYVAVQHCVLIRQAMPDTSWEKTADGSYPYMLRGVSYRYRVDAGITFPASLKGPWAVYLRLRGMNAGSSRVFFRVHFRNPVGRWEHVFDREMDRAVRLADAGEDTQDVVFNLPFFRVGGVGLHAISAHLWYDGVVLDGNDRFREEAAEWATDPEELFGTADWAYGAVEYFWIE